MPVPFVKIDATQTDYPEQAFEIFHVARVRYGALPLSCNGAEVHLSNTNISDIDNMWHDWTSITTYNIRDLPLEFRVNMVPVVYNHVLNERYYLFL